VSNAIFQKLDAVLRKIDRPGSFCVSGSVPAILPGLTVKGMGQVGLPLTSQQAEDLKQHCRQAPYGKGEKTLVDTDVRRVWELKPAKFKLTNPDWDAFLEGVLGQVQQELGLEEQKLQAHLHDLLLYEPGSFFLPHRDGEKLDRMVATLVIVLPSSYAGGELIVRHEGAEKTIDFSGADLFHIHFAAFYADCEHEVRPLREGYRLCLVYNLTLAKGKKRITAPSYGQYIEQISQLLRQWGEAAGPPKLVVTLEHQYTRDGLVWDALKGVDRARADALAEAGRQADCQVYLALLTFYESGSAEDYGGGYGYRSGWYDEDDEDDEDEEYEEEPGTYEMEEVFESSLTVEQLRDPRGNQLPIDSLDVEEEEVLHPEALEAVVPEEEFEGYTGNAGMTLDRWYRHGAIVLWSARRQFDVFCATGSHNATRMLGLLVKQWKKARSGKADELRAQCIAFAETILRQWSGTSFVSDFEPPAASPNLLSMLVALDEPRLIQIYLSEVLPRDASVDPGRSLVTLCQRHGWGTFRRELEVVFQKTTTETLERNVRLLDGMSQAKPRQKEEWSELCQSLGQTLLRALEVIDQDRKPNDYSWRELKREVVLSGLARAFLATEQHALLARLVAHTLARPEKYPLITVHIRALTILQPWLKKSLEKPAPGMTQWVVWCREQLEALTAQAPEAPTDFHREAPISCRCADCGELKKFLADPQEKVWRFRAGESRRRHLEGQIRQHSCDVTCKTERTGSPHTLVCTKNDASYRRNVKTYHENQERLARVRAIEAALPK
jgi:hypothetical protein